MKEIIAMKRSVHQLAHRADDPLEYHCEMLHSEVLDEDEEEQVSLEDTGCSLLILASSVAAPPNQFTQPPVQTRSPFSAGFGAHLLQTSFPHLQQWC